MKFVDYQRYGEDKIAEIHVCIHKIAETHVCMFEKKRKVHVHCITYSNCNLR